MSEKYTYKVVVGGYGGEISVGRVNRATYDYFKENEIDIDEYCSDYDNELNVPEEYQFVPPGSFYECYDFAHESGCEFHELNDIQIVDEDNNNVWSQQLNIEALKQDGVKVEETTLFDRDEQPDGTCVFTGRSIEKGLFAECTITTDSPLDLSKLTINVEIIDGWSLVTSITYDDELLDNENWDTTGKSLEYELFMIGE